MRGSLVSIGLIDVFPTVADLLGWPGMFFPDVLRWMLARREIFAEAWGATRVLTDGTLDPTWQPPAYALRKGNRKLVWTPAGRAASRLEIYDLGNDRGEQRDLAPDHSTQFGAEVDALHRYADAAAAASADTVKAPLQAPDPATAEKLRALGYLR